MTVSSGKSSVHLFGGNTNQKTIDCMVNSASLPIPDQTPCEKLNTITYYLPHHPWTPHVSTHLSSIVIRNDRTFGMITVARQLIQCCSVFTFTDSMRLLAFRMLPKCCSKKNDFHRASSNNDATSLNFSQTPNFSVIASHCISK